MTNEICNFIKRHSSALLTGVSIAGLFSTVGLAIVATKKAVRLMDSKDFDDKNKIKQIAPLYIPTVLAGTATISSILGIHFTNMKTQASLISAYTFLNNSYQEYKSLNEENGSIIKKEIIEKHKDDTPISIDKDEVLFFDYFSLRYFSSTMEKVEKAEDYLNETYFRCGFVSLNEFYDLLGIPRLEFGYEMGWSHYDMDANEYDRIDFIHEEVALKDGTLCYAIVMPFEPLPGYLNS